LKLNAENRDEQRLASKHGSDPGGAHAWLRHSAEVIEATCRHLAQERIEAAISAVAEALAQNRPLLICGNGGSAADAMHITGELVGRFLKERRALRAVCLADNPAVLTAWSNDYSFEQVFARQVEAYGEAGGVLLAISTSGNSPNVLAALAVARRMELVTVGLTGEGGGKMSALCDHLLDVPSRSTPLIQQVHICLYHHICAVVEARLGAPQPA
jgi:D-sedoheptulose 7-phosphate isomerase